MNNTRTDAREWVKHIHEEGSRHHVLSWRGVWDFRRIGGCRAIKQCSEKDCEVNRLAPASKKDEEPK